ncbi:MAG: family 43 glycosylhydrolase [Magnetospirillum sp.]|nr:family 43 glycosylhydrolase [Magnetospirillum sp.]
MKIAAAFAFLLFATIVHGVPTPSVAFKRFTYTGKDAAFSPPLPTGHFRNPILTGYYPDPSICRVGEDYYLINSSFAHFPGIPIFHSHDLVNWRQIGHVVDRPDQLNYDGLGITRGIFAPAISYHKGTFYVACTMVGAGGNFSDDGHQSRGTVERSSLVEF